MLTDKAKDIAFIETPENWPRWPVLPLKRYTTPGEFPETGITLAVQGYRYTVLDATVMNPPRNQSEFDALKKQVYGSAKELVDAGWMVD